MIAKVSFLMVAMVLAGCSPPPPVSDAQVQAVTTRCKELGMSTRVFNSVTVSTAECAPVATTAPRR